MFSYVTLKNVRRFSDSEHFFPLKKLTIFCGGNSAGKSTVLKILPMLRQSLGIGDSGISISGGVRLAGNQADFGGLLNFTSGRNPELQPEISVGIEDKIAPKTLQRLVATYVRPKDLRKQLEKQLSRRKLSQKVIINLEIQLMSPLSMDKNVNVNSKILEGIISRCNVSLFYENSKIFEYLIYIDEKKTGKNDVPEFFIEIPKKYFESVGGLNVVQPIPGAQRFFVRFKCINIVGFNPIIIEGNRLKKRRSSGATSGSVSIAPVPPIILNLTQKIMQRFNDIKYLGPIRAPAKRYYVDELSNIGKSDIRGENVPFILRDKFKDKILLSDPTGRTKKGNLLLGDGVNLWIAFIRTGEFPTIKNLRKELKTEFHKNVLGEILIQSPYKSGLYTLADSGFGYSQVLPIVVRGLLCSAGDTLIVEQPELHLHPATQVRLARFFIYLAENDVQVILETHNEHLINAIRANVAEDEKNHLKNNVSIFYLSSERGSENIHDLSVQDDGSVPAWPPEFFGESMELSGRLMRAAVRRKLIKTKK